MNRFDVVIVGGGPGGLSCAATLAKGGARVMLLERKKNIGAKVCAGGITWHGLIRQVPRQLIQRTFPEQHIFSNWQKICFRKQKPVIATVSRKDLGRWMMEEAVMEGALVRTGCYARTISDRSLAVTDEQGNDFTLHFDHLVGADGSASLVRRYLKIPTDWTGVGINYQVPGQYKRMEWHLNTPLFGSGYGWIFPHRKSVSIGAYALRKSITPERLNRNLVTWAAARGFDLGRTPPRAERVNFDYRGCQFGNFWLVGEAAGLASGLTGEGINPAIISGAEVARKIIDPAYESEPIAEMTRKHQRHMQIVKMASRSKLLCTLLMESLVLLLRMKLVDFQEKLSM